MKRTFIITVVMGFLLSSMNLFAKNSRKVNERVTVQFEKGQIKLNQGEREKLKNTIEKAEMEGRIKGVSVAIWPDAGESGAKKSSELIKERTELLKREISIDRGHNKFVRVYDMSRPDNKLQKVLTAQKQQEDSPFGIQTHSSSERKDAELLTQTGGAGKAVVLIKVKEKK